MKKVSSKNQFLPYKTYIFDLYGTLLDIKTNEKNQELWDRLAGIYSAFGADYTGPGIHSAYGDLCREETEHLKKILRVWHPDMNPEHPEIELTNVFARLLAGAKHKHETNARIGGTSVNLLSAEEIAQSEWAYFISNTFRTLSMEHISCYPNTKGTLEVLRKNGCKLYLLSNAQGIFTRPELEQTGLLPYLDGVFISSEKQIKKPQPEFLEWLIRDYNIDRSSAVMVGNDIQADMGIATACGIPGVFLNTSGLSDKKIDCELSKIGADKKTIRIIDDGDIAHLLD